MPLISQPKETYGEKYQEHLWNQYKLYVEGADKISDRRQKANEFFLTINTALLGFLGLKFIQSAFIITLVCFGAISLCYYWYRLIVSYKNMNGGKFKVIHQIEKNLPLSLYDFEWEMLGRGENKKLYLPFTHIELKIPLVFITLYALIILYNFPWQRILNFLCTLTTNCNIK